MYFNVGSRAAAEVGDVCSDNFVGYILTLSGGYCT
jgi:hypothetical protein